MFLLIAILVAMIIGALLWVRHERKKLALYIAKVDQRQDFFQMIVNDQNELITRYQPDGTFLYVNKSYCKYVGKPDAEIIGRSLFDSVPDSEIVGLRKFLGNSSDPENKDVWQNRLRGLDGTIRNFEWTNLPILDEDGIVIEFQSVGRDVTDRLRMERDLAQSQARYKELSDMASDWVWEMDADLRFTYFSENSKYFVNAADPADLIGKTRREILGEHFELDEKWTAHFAHQDARRPYRDFEYAFFDQYGDKCYRTISGDPVFDEAGEFQGYRGVARDITDRVEAAAQIERQLKDLEQLNQQKNKFFSILAHDLKNPFNILLGYTTYLQDNIDKLDPEKYAQNIALIKDSATNLYGLLEDLLAWGRTQMNRTEYDFQPHHLRELADDGVRAVQEMAANKSIELVVAVENYDVTVDRNSIITVIRNLTSNALKFTEPGGRVTLSATLEDEGVVFSVSDTGVGMKPEAVDGLFHLDLHNSTTGTGGETGTGIGLLLSKEYVTAHGGEMRIDSTPGEGSTFSFTLPPRAATSLVQE